jgi:hypothetical protein
MVAVHRITALAQKETARQAILKRLREAGATSAAMPASIDLDGEQAEAALAELLAAYNVREARTGLYYVDESAKKDARPGQPFVALLAVLIAISFAASLIAIAAMR